MAHITQAELVAWCAQWQRLLRLQDWDIRLKVVERGSLAPIDARGKINWDVHLKTADIQIVVSDDMAATASDYDPKRTVIHELLHIHLMPWEVEEHSMEDTAREQAINAIARAFIIQARQETAAPKSDQAAHSVPRHSGGE